MGWPALRALLMVAARKAEYLRFTSASCSSPAPSAPNSFCARTGKCVRAESDRARSRTEPEAEAEAEFANSARNGGGGRTWKYCTVSQKLRVVRRAQHTHVSLAS